MSDENKKWLFNLFVWPERFLPKLREVPQGRAVERCMIHAPLVEESEKTLTFGKLAS